MTTHSSILAWRIPWTEAIVHEVAKNRIWPSDSHPLKLALLENSHPFYKEHQACLFTEAAICMAQGGLGDSRGMEDTGLQAGRGWKSSADNWQLCCLRGGLGSTSSPQPHSCLFFSGCDLQDPQWPASCSWNLAWMPTLSTAPPPFSGSPPGMKVEGEMEAPWTRPAGGAPLALLLCSQRGQHWLLGGQQDNLWSLQGDSQEQRAPVKSCPKPLGHLFLFWTRWAASEAAAQSLAFPFPQS